MAAYKYTLLSNPLLTIHLSSFTPTRWSKPVANDYSRLVNIYLWHNRFYEDCILVFSLCNLHLKHSQ